MLYGGVCIAGVIFSVLASVIWFGRKNAVESAVLGIILWLFTHVIVSMGLFVVDRYGVGPTAWLTAFTDLVLLGAAVFARRSRPFKLKKLIKADFSLKDAVIPLLVCLLTLPFVHSKNASSTTLKNLDLSLPVYAEDGVTQYKFSPYALGRSDLGGRIVSGSGVTNIVLHPGCKSLGRYCFKGCTELVKVTLNDGLEEICEDAFRDDKVLAEIVNFFPGSLKSIGVRAFDSCTALSGIAVANGLETMENRAFIYCNALQGFNCGRSSLAKVDTSTFYKDTALETVVLPDTVTDISSGAFYQCTSLTNFTPLLPPALQALGTPSNNDRPLYDCPILGHVVSPHTLTNLLSNSFRGTHIESFTSAKRGIRSIGQYAFSRCSNLTNVVLSADLESIASDWLYNVASTGSAHVWFRNLPGNLPGNLWANTTKQHITIHLPWSQQDAWREWVASGPSGHTFTFNKATKTLPEHLNDVGTWLSSVTQNVTWWKDRDPYFIIVVR